MSNTPSARMATTEGPASSGRHTRPTSVPEVESAGRVDSGDSDSVIDRLFRHGRACPGHPDEDGTVPGLSGMPGTRPGMTEN